jgi:ferrochelatase
LKSGVLIINLGTPDDTSVSSVRRYLRQFLSDPRVLDIPALGRWALLNLVILPFRPKESAEAYSTIWTDRGSPLKYHTEDLTNGLAEHLSDDIPVRFAMRYQNPSLETVLQQFHEDGVERLFVVPMYPQYASSSTGSCLEELYKVAAKDWNAPSLVVLPPFYDHPAYLDVSADIAKDHLEDLNQFDHILMSFHGLPERHVKKCDLEGGNYCLSKPDCCAEVSRVNRYCYRAQCYETARQIAKRLDLAEEDYTVAFQSRLGRTPWIQPYTDEEIKKLGERGVRKLAVMIPSFTADCLETLEEIAIRGEEEFQEAGGESLTMVPSLNADPRWIEAILKMLVEHGLPVPEQVRA